MSNSALSKLETSLRRRIGRRLALARWAKLLLVPTVGGTVYIGQRSQWLVFAGILLLLLEVLAIMVGESQRCPLCDASLVIRQDRREEFANACPQCGYLID